MRACEIQPSVLNEISMRPASLAREAARVGAKVGIEFEMVVPDVEAEEPEPQPDYSDDPSTTSIEQVIRFFDNRDFNSRRSLQDMQERMEEQYDTWFNEHAIKEWEKVEREKIQEWVEENEIDVDDAIEQYLEDTLNLDSQELRVALAAGKRASEFTSSKQLRLWAEENDPYAQYKEAADYAAAEVDRLVDRMIMTKNEKHSAVYEGWLDNYRDDNWSDLQKDWMYDQGLHRMSDIENSYANFVTWPVWTTPDNSGKDIAAVADSFTASTGYRANWSSRYHGATRSSKKWSIEPDGSISVDNAGDSGLEFISPPLSLDEMTGAIDAVYTWAEERGCYTNNTTGLHMNVSVPNYSRDNLDFVKLAVLLGDKWVLEQFKRSTSTYCRSAFDKIVRDGAKNPHIVAQVFEALKSRLNGIASIMIHNGYTAKYSSINVKDTYVEFRSPGDDYLSDSIKGKILPTLHRFIVVLEAACDIDAYREEYIKKLERALSGGGLSVQYWDPRDPRNRKQPTVLSKEPHRGWKQKVTSQAEGMNIVSVFARWSAGLLDKEEITNYLRLRSTERKRAADTPQTPSDTINLMTAQAFPPTVSMPAAHRIWTDAEYILRHRDTGYNEYRFNADNSQEAARWAATYLDRSLRDRSEYILLHRSQDPMWVTDVEFEGFPVRIHTRAHDRNEAEYQVRQQRPDIFSNPQSLANYTMTRISSGAPRVWRP